VAEMALETGSEVVEVKSFWVTGDRLASDLNFEM